MHHGLRQHHFHTFQVGKAKNVELLAYPQRCLIVPRSMLELVPQCASHAFCVGSN